MMYSVQVVNVLTVALMFVFLQDIQEKYLGHLLKQEKNSLKCFQVWLLAFSMLF